MKTRTGSALALGLAAVVAAGYVATGRGPAVADGPRVPEKDQAAKERRAEFIKAYDAGDAKAVADFWTEDATYVDADGRAYKGRADIQKLYEKVFAASKGAKLAIHPTASKMLSPDVLLNEGVTEVTPADGGPPTAASFSAVLVKKDGQWYLQSVHDSEAAAPSNSDHLDDLAWLIGEWKGESDKGESGSADFTWAQNENFIVSDFATTVNGAPVSGGTQWIGWDAAEKRVRSWSFYSGGGFGQAAWTKDGNRWLVKTTAQTREGKKVSATNVVTKTDDDHMTWQMTELVVDGKLLPDPAPVKMKRDRTPEP
jgi:uncharacterized protein (TIGR02246 family)